ncbi:MAG: hypothetical protein JW704_05175 [Anaerolineaceae bacterium]|nr:hypothetical protein [Anaerolineaceae bacterium]
MEENPVITKALELIEAQQFQQAAYHLSSFLKMDPSSPDSIPAWLLMARVVDTTDKKVDCLQRVLSIDPGNETALEALKHVTVDPPVVPGITAMRVESDIAEDAAPAESVKPFIDMDDRISSVIGSTEPVLLHDEMPAPTVNETPSEMRLAPDQTLEKVAALTPDNMMEDASIPIAVDIPPEINKALAQIKSIQDFFEGTETITEKFQGTAGPDYQRIRAIIAEQVSAGYMLQNEEYTPQKLFGKPEVTFTFAKPRALFKNFCHDYPYVCTRYNSQESYLEFNLESVVGKHLACIYRSLEKRTAGLELLRCLTPDRRQIKSQAVVREADDEHLVVDLYWGKRVMKIGEILRDRKGLTERVNDANGTPLLHLVEHSGTDPKRVTYTIQTETNLLRYQIQTFDYSTREMLLRVGNPIRLPEEVEAVILMTGLLAVDYML